MTDATGILDIPGQSSGFSAVARTADRAALRSGLFGFLGLAALLLLTAGCSLFGPRDSGAHDSDPAWSPDGSTIVYVRRVDSEPPELLSFWGLYLIDANGKNNRMLLQGDYGCPGWSPDGRWLAFTDYRDMQVYRVKINGDSLTQLTSAGRNYYPDWSVAHKIAFDSNLDHPRGAYAVWTMDADGTSKRPLQPLSEPYEGGGREPSWSPDGSRLVFCRYYPEGQGFPDLAIMDSAGQGQVRLTDEAFDHSSPVWSPDGDIAVCRCSPQGVYVWVLDLQGMEWMRLPQEGAISPTWSPDGQMICFADLGEPPPEPWEPQTRAGRHLWIVRRDGTGLRQLTR